MKTLTLERYCYSEECIEGWLWLNAETRLHTLERPWRAGAPGGMPFVSGVPDGAYDLLPHVRADGTQVYALRNPDHGVYYERGERPGAGRYLILIHSGNFVEESQGCILPGVSRTIYNNRVMVTNSRQAMQMILDAKPKQLVIECACGTD